MVNTRAPTSPHGRLFGGDSMYQVLHEVARRRRRTFNAHQISQATGRHPSQVQRDLDRLVVIGVLESVTQSGAAKPLRCRTTRLARTVISLPMLIESEIGEYSQAATADHDGLHHRNTPSAVDPDPERA
jgi:hypothetical protein